MLMAGLGGCRGPRSPTAAGRGRDGRGMEAGSLRGVATAVGPLCPSQAPAGSTILFSAWALDVQGQTPVPEASPRLPSLCGPQKATTSKGESGDHGVPVAPWTFISLLEFGHPGILTP